MNNIKKLGVAAATFGFSMSTAHADISKFPISKAPIRKVPAEAMPRGADIDPLAGNCSIGPFHQTTKAGPYNVLCDVMTDSEKCLALIKGRFNNEGEVYPVSTWDQEKMIFCLETLTSDLGIETAE